MSHQIQSLTLQSMVMETHQEIPAIEFDPTPAAFGAIYRAYLQPVYRYLYARVGNPGDAEDLTSQVFLAALEGLPRYKHQGYFAAWLFSIARRKAADFYRQGSRVEALDPEMDPPSPQGDLLAQVVHQENLARLARLTAGLPEEERELLRLRFAACLSFAEIAVVLNRKTSAVKMSLYRLLERMENQLEARRD
jgi:RNA polymerase sigma-70 factor (ECF subfamily)